MKAKKIFGFIFMLFLFGVFFWLVDIKAIKVFLWQYQTNSFPCVKGEILSGQVTQWTGSKGGVHYRPSFSYRYAVKGQTYDGKRFRYDGQPSFYNELEANQMVAAHPKGSEIVVYYNPNNPTESVLSPGLNTYDLGIPFVFGSMTVLFFSILIKLGKEIDWHGKGTLPAGGVRIIEDRMTIRARLPRYQPSSTGLSIACFLSIIVGVVLQNGKISYPPVATGLLTLTGIIIVSSIVYLWLRQRVESGLQDLVIDEGARTIELPLTFKRRKRTPLTFGDVTSIAVEKILNKKRAGPNFSYAVKLVFRDQTPQILTILKQENAESFAAWLREKIGIKTELP